MGGLPMHYLRTFLILIRFVKISQATLVVYTESQDPIIPGPNQGRFFKRQGHAPPVIQRSDSLPPNEISVVERWVSGVKN